MSHLVDRMLGESISDIANVGFAIAWERAMTRQVSISRRLDKLDGRLLHIVFEVVASRIKVDTIEVMNEPRHSWEAWPHSGRRRRVGSMWHVMLLHIAFRDCLRETVNLDLEQRYSREDTAKSAICIGSRRETGSIRHQPCGVYVEDDFHGTGD